MSLAWKRIKHLKHKMKLSLLPVAIVALVKAAERSEEPLFPPCADDLYNFGGICCPLNTLNYEDTACVDVCPNGMYD